MLTGTDTIKGSVIHGNTKHFSSMPDLSDELNSRQSRYVTEEIDGKKCRISQDGVLTAEVGNFRFREFGYGQMLGMLGIPRGYADRIPNDLLQHDINRLFEEKGVRTKIVRDGDQIRGFMSAKRACVPNVQLLAHLASTLDGSDLTLSQAELSDTTLRVKVVSPQMKMEVPRVGDVYSVGMEVCNSDVGAVSLEASAYTLCLKCTNGMIAPRDIWGVRKSRFGKNYDHNTMLDSFMLDLDGIVTKLDRLQHCLLKSSELTVTENQLAFLSGVIHSVIHDEEAANTRCGQFSLSSTVYEAQYEITLLSQQVDNILQRRRIEAYAGRMVFGDPRMFAGFSAN